jgi:hypothetical protein
MKCSFIGNWSKDDKYEITSAVDGFNSEAGFWIFVKRDTGGVYASYNEGTKFVHSPIYGGVTEVAAYITTFYLDSV